MPSFKIILKFRFSIFLLLFLIGPGLNAQQKKPLTVEDIWASGSLWPQQLPGFAWIDDHSYSELTERGIVKKEVLSGKETGIIFDNVQGIEIEDYSFNEHKTRILIQTATEQIYRHSSKAIWYLYDIPTKSLRKISEEKIAYASLSPDEQKIAYIKENNIWYADLRDLKAVPVTTDGKINAIINGTTDWVYEEEFSITRVYDWSADSKKIAYLKFDESEVKEYNLQLWNGLYPSDYRYKYPKAGEANSRVTAHCYFLPDKQTKIIPLPEDSDTYIPRLRWTRNPDVLSLQTLNRLQNHFQLLHINVVTSQTLKVYEEKNNSYVEINDDLRYLSDGKHFLLTSEKDGFKHIYQYDMNGNQVRQITKGNWEVDKIASVDEKNSRIYYTSTEASPLERHLYVIPFSGNRKKRLTEAKGTHDVEISPGSIYFVDNYSTINAPSRYSIHLSASGKEVKTFEDNSRLKKTMEDFRISPAEFLSYKVENGTELNGYMIRPSQMETGKKYPVLLFVYGGPGYQSVTDGWKGPNYFWFQMLAQQGYVVVSIDNRGTGGRGADFKKITQNALGKYETEDVISTARYLGTLPYIDQNRIGIFGWSFGGYLASLALTLGAEYFKAGIAVAPVTSWRFYDTIYTERYLGLPQQNGKGYDDYSPITHAGKLKGNYLLVHGTADDNVHVQNALMMQEALIKANKQFEVFYYPNKNHGIYGGNTRLHLYKLMTDFFQRKL